MKFPFEKLMPDKEDKKMSEFIEYPKTSRLYSPVTISEKIDGTNAAIIIDDLGTDLYCQSRNKVITPQDDNAGFARWCHSNKETLLSDLGPGVHFGEFWGAGIGRKYDMKVKVFSLFNTRRFDGAEFKTPNLRVVPILYEGPYTDTCVEEACLKLKTKGSLANAGFMKPEGVCVFWQHDNTVKKVPFDK